MKPSALYLLSLSVLGLPTAIADFHIVWGDGNSPTTGPPVGIFGSSLIPSDSYDCHTMTNARNYDEYNTEAAREGEAIDFMRYEFGVCDSGTLNFWYRREDDEYDVYLENGDGTVLERVFSLGEPRRGVGGGSFRSF